MVLVGTALVFILGGTVAPQTIRISDGTSSVHPLYGELQSKSSVGYQENFSGWRLSDLTSNIKTSLNSQNKSITLKGEIGNASTPSTAGMIKDVTVNITWFPVLEANLTVSEGIHYGLRFFGLLPNSTISRIWWEGSPLDHRPGVGREELRINMPRQVFLATGHNGSSIVRFELYIESGPENPRTFDLELDDLRLSSYPLTAELKNQQYRAIYIDMRADSFNGPWPLYRIQVGVTLDADPDTSIGFLLLKGYELYTTSVTPINYKYREFARDLDVAFYPSQSDGIFGEMLPISNVSMVIVAQKGAINSIKLDYFDLVYLPTQESNPDLPLSLSGFYYVYLLFFLFLLPVGLALIVYHEFFKSLVLNRSGIWAVLMIGITCRLALAPLTSHPFDMNILLVSARGWFQYGSTRASQGPTLPAAFFAYWIPYSFYALLQKLGLKDSYLPWSESGVIESLFVKLLPITADVLVFIWLLLFKKRGKNLVWATFFFLNPLAIFTSSITGHYDSALLLLLLIGGVWLSDEKTIRAGVALMAASLLQLIGFVPYVLTILKTGIDKRYRLSFMVVSVGLLTLVYPPQRELSLRVLFSILGLTNSSQFSAGEYTLLGSLGLTELTSRFHVLLIVVGLVLVSVLRDSSKRSLQPAKVVLYTCLSATAVLLLLNLPSEWIWLIPIGLLYASIIDNCTLGVYVLPFGTALCFHLLSLVGSAYYLFGTNVQPILAPIEGARSGLLIFNLVTTMLATLYLAYLVRPKTSPSRTLIRSSILIVGAYCSIYFSVGVLTG